MTAKQCDGCGKFYTENSFTYKSQTLTGIMFTAINTPVLYGKSFDLCDDCLEKLIKHLDKISGRGRKMNPPDANKAVS